MDNTMFPTVNHTIMDILQEKHVHAIVPEAMLSLTLVQHSIQIQIVIVDLMDDHLEVSDIEKTKH
jgi:hypothetical protein